MESRFFLDVVIGECTAVLELLTGKDETLLVGRDAFFILDFRFNIIDRVGGFNFESDS